MHPLLSTSMFAPWNDSSYILRVSSERVITPICIKVWIREGKITLISLCIIPFLCRYSRPNSNCFVYILITCSDKNFKMLYVCVSQQMPIIKKVATNNLQTQEKIQTSLVKMIWIRLEQTLTKYSESHPLWQYPSTSADQTRQILEINYHHYHRSVK